MSIRQRNRISVVIPAHNAERFLEETLRSVNAQTRRPDEVIVVDDLSSDSTGTIAERLGARVIRPERNGGCARARNIGIAAATGSLIALLDADDIWLPEHLAGLEELMTRFPEVVLAYSRAQLFGELEWTQEPWLAPGAPEDAIWACTRRNIIIPSGVLLRASAAREAGCFDESLRLLEDFEFWRRLARRGAFVCAEEITLKYRKYGGQASSRIRECRRVEYEIRRRWLREAEAGPREDYARVLKLTREAWSERLEEAWHSRSWSTMLMTLQLGAATPRLWKALLTWAPRLVFFPLLPVWDRLRPIVRQS